jgi:hypothetical protein
LCLIEEAKQKLFLFSGIRGVCENVQELRNKLQVVRVGSSPIELSGPEKVNKASQYIDRELAMIVLVAPIVFVKEIRQAGR